MMLFDDGAEPAFRQAYSDYLRKRARPMGGKAVMEQYIASGEYMKDIFRPLGEP